MLGFTVDVMNSLITSLGSSRLQMPLLPLLLSLPPVPPPHPVNPTSVLVKGVSGVRLGDAGGGEGCGRGEVGFRCVGGGEVNCWSVWAHHCRDLTVGAFNNLRMQRNECI